jgi:hypothetical protein
MSLRNKVIKLAYEVPSLRGDLIPLLKEAAFTWDTTTEEIYSFMSYSFDVRKAKEILTKKKHKVHEFDPTEWADIAKRHTGMKPKNINLEIPVIFATPKPGIFLPIDGWNRIQKAIKEGVPELPAVMLNLKETAQILL